MGAGNHGVQAPSDERGKLEDRALPDLLCSICARRQTGVLHLIRHDTIKSIYIDQGRIVFASSTDPDDRLGELLLRRGLLRVQELDNALACLTREKRLGGLLVEMGYLKPEALVQAIVDQVRDIVFGLFLWTDGEYRFEVGDLPTREVITLRLSTPEVILGGIRRIDRWWRVVSALGSLDAVFRLRPGHEEVLREMRPGEAHARIAGILRQPTRVRDLCGLGILPDFEVCQTLWAFRVMGIAEPTDEPAKKPLAAAAQGEPAVPAIGAEDLDQALGAAMLLPGDIGPISAAAPAGAVQEEPQPPAEASSGPLPATLKDGGDEADSVLSAGVVGLSGADGVTPGTSLPTAAGSEDRDPEDATAEVIEDQTDGGPAAMASAASPEPPPGPAGAASDDAAVAAEVTSFNARQRRLYALLQEKMGEQAAGFVARALKGMARELPGLFAGLVAQPDGTLGADALKANLSKQKMGRTGLAAALGLFVERELEAVAGILGPAARREIASSLEELTARVR